MAKHKIPKNRSLEDMFKGVKEEVTFETADWDDEETVARRPVVKKKASQQTAEDLPMICKKRSELFFSISRWLIIKTV